MSDLDLALSVHGVTARGTMSVIHPHAADMERNPVVKDGIGEAQHHQDIARLAYAIWQDRGCPHGTDLEDWLEAEQQLSKRHAASTA